MLDCGVVEDLSWTKSLSNLLFSERDTGRVWI
jgi:hypothetical protein